MKRLLVGFFFACFLLSGFSLAQEQGAPIYFKSAWVNWTALSNRYDIVWSGTSTSTYPDWAFDTTCFSRTNNSFPGGYSRVVFFSSSISSISKLQSCAAQIEPPRTVYLSEANAQISGASMEPLLGFLMSCLLGALMARVI